MRLQQCICISEAAKIIICQLIATCVSYYLQQRKSNIIEAGQLEITVANMGGAHNGKKNSLEELLADIKIRKEPFCSV